MAHGSNEINVSAPLAAEMFMLNPNYETVQRKEEFIAIAIGLVSVLFGTLTLGVRYLNKYRNKFMKVTLANGFIANTCVSLALFLASSLNFTVSCTYILAPCLLLLRKKDENKKINKYKAVNAVIFAVSITLISAFLSVSTSWILLYLDYDGPYHNQN